MCIIILNPKISQVDIGWLFYYIAVKSKSLDWKQYLNYLAEVICKYLTNSKSSNFYQLK